LIVCLFLQPGYLLSQDQSAIGIHPTFGQDPFAKRILRQTNLNPTGFVPVDDVKPLVNSLLKSYEDNGYPFARIWLDSLRLEKDQIEATLNLDRGPRITYDTILNRTGLRLSPAVMNRIINLFPGDLYSESKLRDASRRIAATGFLREARTMEVGFHSNLASLFLFPERTPSNRFDGWIGLAPGASSGEGITLAGSVLMEFYNLLGQAESWNLNWKRNQDQSQRMLLTASVPFLLGLPAGIGARFDLLRQDTSYLNLTWELGIPYYFKPNHQLYLFYRSRKSQFLHNPNDQPNSSLQPFDLWLTGISWNIRSLDDIINPQKGISCQAEASIGRKSVQEMTTPLKQSEFVTAIAAFIPIIPRLVISPTIQSGIRISDLALDNERYRLGGYQHLRGFDEETFLADRYLTGSLELRYLLDRHSHLLVLTDFGLLSYHQEESWVIQKPFSLGFGGQFRTGGGIIRILFAAGSTTDAPMNLRSAKIHLGYVGLF